MCNSILFADLCQAFQRVEDMSSEDKKETKGVKFKTIFTKKIRKGLHGHSIYPLARLVAPTADTQQRGTYGLRQNKVADIYIKNMNLVRGETEAAALLARPLHPGERRDATLKTGDFGAVLESILSKRLNSKSSNWTLGDVNSFLDDLVRSTDKLTLIKDKMIQQLSPNEQKWIMRIVLGEIGGHIGFKEDYLFNHLWECAKSWYDTTSSLLRVCNELCDCQRKGGSNSFSPSSSSATTVETEALKIRLFDRFSPMLARGLNNAGDQQVRMAVDAMKGKAFSAEVKLDGERMLMHRGNLFFFSSR